MRLSHSWLWADIVNASDEDAELCNDESDKIPGGGCSRAAKRRTGTGGRSVAASGGRETRGRESTERPRREPCALSSAEPFCSLLTHSSVPGTLHRGQDALSYVGTRLESLHGGVRACGDTR